MPPAPIRQLTARQIQDHPEYPHAIWDLKPSRAGLVDVSNPNSPVVHDSINNITSLATKTTTFTKSPQYPSPSSRPSSLNISYAVHGHGPRRLLLIMGLGGIKESWQRQYRDFGHYQADKYSVLVLDNRGIGDSSCPWGRYSTSEMAWDIIGLLRGVGWLDDNAEKRRGKARRDCKLHIVGVSMGGMILQELLHLLPPHFVASAVFLSTASHLVSFKGILENVIDRASLFTPKSLDTQLAYTKTLLYTRAYLTSPDKLEYTVEPYPSAGDRFAALELHKRLDNGGTKLKQWGFLAQAMAANWHHKTPKQLSKIADGIGRERLLVIHGDGDEMIDVRNGHMLAEGLNDGVEEGKGPKVRLVIWEHQNHGILGERREELAEMLEELMDKAEAMDDGFRM